MIGCRKAVAALLCLAMVLGVSACGKKTVKGGSSGAVSSSSKASSGTASAVSSAAASSSQRVLALPVTLDKSLNPLTTDSMNNLVLWPLMYDCLAEPGQDYAPVMGLASSVDVNGMTVTAHLRASLLFSDGTALTARDVQYSYNLVKGTPASFFSSNVANIASVETSGTSTVIFHLNSPNPLIANLLNVPIIKYNSDHLNDSYATTGINVPPVGSGRYTFSTNSFSGTLSVNKSWYKGASPNFKTIDLVNMLNGSSTFSSLKIGETDLMFTDYGNGAMSAVGLSTATVYLNRMVFMGVNSNRAGLSDAKVRTAISLAMNRKTIVSNVYSSRAAAAVLPFNPKWTGVAKPTDTQAAANVSLAGSTLSGAGYTVKNASGALTGTVGGQTVTLHFTLLVNKDNSTMLTAAKQLISDLNKVGILITLDAQSGDAYMSKLAQNDFDLYLGEITQPDDMDLSAFLVPGGAAAYDVPQDSKTLAAFNAWRSGSGAITTLTDAFSTETPFIPICYKYGTVTYAKGLSGTITPTYYDVFQNMESWSFK